MVDQAPGITSPGSATFGEGSSSTFDVSATGFPSPSLSESGDLPSGVTFSDNGDGTGSLSGTPGPGSDGSYAVTITATNGAGTTTQTFTLTVGQAPVISSANHATFTVGELGSFGISTGTSFPAPSLSQSGSLPAGVAFLDNGDGTGSLSGTPVAGTGGTYRITITATNGLSPQASQNFTLTVLPNTTAPGLPTGLKVSAAHGSAKLTWKAPATDGGSSILNYVITAYVGATAKMRAEVGDVLADTITGLTNGTAYTFTVAATNSVGAGKASSHSPLVTPDGLYITTKALASATKGKTYSAVRLAERYGAGTEKWTAAGLPSGLTLSSTGVLSGKVKSTDTVKTYSVSVTVKDSSKPSQTVRALLNLKVLA